jgi:hypothetical protein
VIRETSIEDANQSSAAIGRRYRTPGIVAPPA